MKNSTSELAKRYLSFARRFRFQDYVSFAGTVFFGYLAANGEGWLITGAFLLSLYFSGEKIVKVYQRKDGVGFEYYCEKANKEYNSENYLKAINFINKGLTIGSNLKGNPNLHTAYQNRGISRLMLDDYEASISDCTIAIQIDPSNGQAYYSRGFAKLKNGINNEYEEDIRKAIELGDKNAVKLLESISQAKSGISLLNPADNLEEWRTSQSLLARNAAYIQTYERYIEFLDDKNIIEEFKGLKDQLYTEYFVQLDVANRYKDAYMLFRLRNLTAACMAINMNGQSLEDKEAFSKYFLHPLFDETDTRLRKKIGEEEIQRQFDNANELEKYIVYSCSIYCNKLLNLIDGDTREERDSGENYDTFLEIQSFLENRKMVDEIFVVREAMIWTIASTNVDLVTSAEDSSAYEVKAFNLLSGTNKYGWDYGDGPYRKDEILKSLYKRFEWQNQMFQESEGYSISDYKQKLSAMTDSEIYEEAAGEDSSLSMREFLNRWGQASQVAYGVEDLRQAVINDYAYLCYQDGGTQPDETSLEEFKKNVKAMSLNELMSETSVIETSAFKTDELVDYIKAWINKSEFAELAYEQTSDGGTILQEVKEGD